MTSPRQKPPALLALSIHQHELHAFGELVGICEGRLGDELVFFPDDEISEGTLLQDAPAFQAEALGGNARSSMEL